MALAVVLFVAGYSKYTHQEPKGSPLERLIGLSWGAVVEWTRSLFSRGRGGDAEYAVMSRTESQTDEDLVRRLLALWSHMHPATCGQAGRATSCALMRCAVLASCKTGQLPRRALHSRNMSS